MKSVIATLFVMITVFFLVEGGFVLKKCPANSVKDVCSDKFPLITVYDVEEPNNDMMERLDTSGSEEEPTKDLRILKYLDPKLMEGSPVNMILHHKTYDNINYITKASIEDYRFRINEPQEVFVCQTNVKAPIPFCQIIGENRDEKEGKYEVTHEVDANWPKNDEKI